MSGTDTVVPLAAFAALLQPKIVTRTVMVRGRPVQVPVDVDPGDPNEVWLMLLKLRHGHERHTVTEWHGLIDRYRDEPAHPADSRYRQ